MMIRVLSGLAALMLLAACQTSNQLASSSPTPSGHVIPWAPLQPNLSPPSPSPGPAPIPVNTPACQANELQGAVIGSNGATGHVLTTFAFVGVGPGSCYLDGTPSVGLLDSGGHLLAFRQQAPFMPTQQPGQALVDPGPVPTAHTDITPGQARLTIDWMSQPGTCPDAQPVVPTQALISIPGGGVLSIAIPSEPAAYVCQGLGVGAFEGPYVPIYPSPPPPLPAIAMQVPGSVRAGTGLHYMVTLTADKKQPFDFNFLCPTLEEEMFADIVNGSPPLGGKHAYALNCGPAGVLKPGASVTFEIVFMVPAEAAPGKYTLMFGLGYWNGISTFTQAPVTVTH